MKKSFLVIFLLIFLFFNGLASLTMAQTTTEEATNVAPIVKIKSAGGFINDAKNLLKETWQKAATSKRGEVVSAWFAQRKQAMQDGWQEEKQEFNGNLKETISDIWQKTIDKIKSWVFHKKEG